MAEPLPFDVELGKVREFAQATRAPELTGADASSAPVCPPTFLISTMYLGGPEHSARAEQRDFGRVLHAEQEFLFHGPPPRAGEQLVVQQVPGGVVVKQGRRGGELVFTRTDSHFRDTTGRLVATAHFTVVQIDTVPTRAE